MSERDNYKNRNKVFKRLVTENDVKEKRKKSFNFAGILIAIFTVYVCTYAGYNIRYDLSSEGNIVKGLLNAILNIFSFKLFFNPLCFECFLGFVFGLVLAFLLYIFVTASFYSSYHHKAFTSNGSAAFMNDDELKAYQEVYGSLEEDPPVITYEDCKKMSYAELTDNSKYSQQLIMSNNFTRPLNSRTLIGNNSVVVIGGAGSGKSRFFIKPNLLQMNCSYLITDPSGEMIASVGKCLEAHGYKIKIFNISEMRYSNTYNPIKYIRDEVGVRMVVECLIRNTSSGEAKGDNQFFVDAEKLIYSACIFYLIQEQDDETKRNFAEIFNMINSLSIQESNGARGNSYMDRIFADLDEKTSLAKKYYVAFNQAAGKTLKSIVISCVTRLQPFMTPQIINLTSSDNIELDKLSDEKTALFIITPQADHSYSFLSSMMYTQLFEVSYHKGEMQKAAGGSEELKVPIRCLMDEFANIGEIPEFPSRLATMRKYNISAVICLQDIAQIEAMYKDSWKTLVANCSTTVFLGSPEPNTLKYIEERLGTATIRTRNNSVDSKKSSFTYSESGRSLMNAEELGRLSPDDCIVLTMNLRPVYQNKFKYETHKYYPLTGDANKEYMYLYQQKPIYDNSKASELANWQSYKAYRDKIKRSIAYREAKDSEKEKSLSDVELLIVKVTNKLTEEDNLLINKGRDLGFYYYYDRKNELPRKYLPKAVLNITKSINFKKEDIASGKVEVNSKKTNAKHFYWISPIEKRSLDLAAEVEYMPHVLLLGPGEQEDKELVDKIKKYLYPIQERIKKNKKGNEFKKAVIEQENNYTYIIMPESELMGFINKIQNDFARDII